MNVDILQNISHSNKSVSTKYPLSLSTRSTILYSRHEKAPCANAGKHTDQIEYSISDQKKKSKEKYVKKGARNVRTMDETAAYPSNWF